MFECRIQKLALITCVTLIALPHLGRAATPGQSPQAPTMLVTVQQHEIFAAIEEMKLRRAALEFFLADTIVNQTRKKRAESAIAPVRTAMSNYRFDQKALAASRESAERVAWLGVTRSELNADASSTRLIEAVKKSEGPQLLSLRYEYALDNNFKLLKVAANVLLVPTSLSKQNMKDLGRRSPSGDFHRRIVCVLPLGPEATESAAENASFWAQQEAKPLREALDRAHAKLVAIAQQSLEEYRSASGSAQDNQQPILRSTRVQADSDGTLVFNDGGLWTYYFKAETQESE